MKRYNFFEALYKSFYSSDLYRDVESNWGGEVGWYLMMVLAFCWVFATFGVHAIITSTYNGLATEVIQQLPVTQIKDGEVTTPENRPYIAKNPENQKPFIVIDTSGEYTALEDAYPSILITKNTLITRSSTDQVKTIKISPNVSEEFDPINIKAKVDPWIKWSWLFIFPVFLLGAFLYRIFQAFVYALLGKCFALAVGVRINYINVVKLCIVALTPVIVVSTLLNLFHIEFPFQFLIYFLISMGYLAFAICAQKKKKL